MDDVISTEPFPIDTGHARFAVDGDSVTLHVNGLPSSQWFWSRPDLLEFEYMNWMMTAVAVVFPASARLRCLHLGAGACSLARAIVHGWPRSRHLAVEVDAKLAAAVRAQVPLPRSPVLRIRVADAVEVLQARPPGGHDLAIRDVFDAAGRTPDGLTGPQAAAWAASALGERGLYLANCGDQPRLPAARREVRDLAEAFPYVAVIAEAGQWRGRRRGNAVLVAAGSQLSAGQERELARRLAGAGFPARLLPNAEARAWAA
ncbi:MAG: fused MFS/spermidine synthase [Bifidobacteriaceae bacterium]|jgi:spermidine synthase|nr:fused MFS/spermidine synthase [Bifidobacteriaceae bacterium]